MSYIDNPKNAFKVDGWRPRCPKAPDCLNETGGCSYSTGCRQTIRFFQEKTTDRPYRYFILNFTYPLYKQVNGDGYIEENSPALSNLLHRSIFDKTALIAV